MGIIDAGAESLGTLVGHHRLPQLLQLLHILFLLHHELIVGALQLILPRSRSPD